MILIIYLGHGGPKRFNFGKAFFDNFCVQNLCLSSHDFEVRETMHPLDFIEMNGFNQLFRPQRPQKLCSSKKQIRPLLLLKFMLFLFSFAGSRKKIHRLVFFFETNDANQAFRP